MPSVLGTSVLAEVAGAITDFFEKLAGPDGTIWLAAFKRFLRKENPWGTVVFPVWKTIKLGTGLTTADDFRNVLRASGCRIGNWANDILGQPAFMASPEEQELDLVVVSVAELGFKNGATRKDIYKRAQELGLDFCPAEVGPQLRLEYKDQPNGEWFLIGMEPIADSDGDLKVFLVGHVELGQWLDGSGGIPEGFWLGDRRWVFARRKPARNATA